MVNGGRKTTTSRELRIRESGSAMACWWLGERGKAAVGEVP